MQKIIHVSFCNLLLCIREADVVRSYKTMKSAVCHGSMILLASFIG